MHEEIEQFVQAFKNRIEGRTLSIPEFCEAMSAAYQQNPLLCDLLSISVTILEQNTDLEVIRDIKLSGLEQSQMIVDAIAASLKDADDNIARQIAFVSGVIVMGLWPMASPQAKLRQIAKLKGLETLAFDFQKELRGMLEAQIKGLIS
ncbi:hypothetical protein [Kiloniella sp. b19]|uniref:hypothetical protein n=1 Tax=Kiloniella sp. GXU_MW_B19 TaxID=3141326 RepID=UPI0031D56E27